MNLRNLAIGSILVIVLFGVLTISYFLTNQSQPETIQKEINAVRQNDGVKWKSKSKNILIEYSDFQCPACKTFHDVIDEIEKISTPDAAYVFRHFPLYQIHDKAYVSSYAAEAAKKQGKFWEMEKALYDNQSNWSTLANPTEYFKKLANEIGLDVKQFEEDLKSESVKNNVAGDLSEAEKLKLNATPTFFLNGKKLEISDFNQFKELILSL